MIFQPQVKHESIELGFRKGIRSLLLDGVLRGEDKEWRLKSVFLSRGGDMMFLHRFKERSLRLRGSSVDFVGKKNIGKYRAFNKFKGFRPGRTVVFNNFRAGNVARHQVRCKLNAAELQVKNLRKRFDEEGLCEARHANK